MNYKDLSTKCIHSGELPTPEGSPHTPVYNSTTFAFPSTEALLDVVEGRKSGSLYTRYGLNPSIQSLEEKLAAIEGAESALVFSSGMAAESALFLTHGKKGIVCIGDAYGGTIELLDSQLRSLNIPVYFLLGRELDRLESILQKGIGLVFFETPTNPTLEIFDIMDISRLSHKYGSLVAIDNTFATPVNQNPISLGADIVIHSATKYLGGHSDITAGAVMGSRSLLNPLLPWRKNLGQMIAPEVASLLSRSIKTLVVRVERQNQTALHLARSLSGNPNIKRVCYPGLDEFPGHDIAKRQMKGFGGMLTLELKQDLAGTIRAVDRLKLFKIAPSLGGTESLATQPVTTTHHGMSEEELQRRGISGSMIRLSVGLESAEDLLSDLNQAIAEGIRGR